mmetsp:Transcript_18148/g.64279  ORF Transcript_18148/g.64279 Transcript_18148/m.64279 type:complete len:234 (-) Transcript_18148:338-1039(-)
MPNGSPAFCVVDCVEPIAPTVTCMNAGSHTSELSTSAAFTAAPPMPPYDAGPPPAAAVFQLLPPPNASGTPVRPPPPADAGPAPMPPPPAPPARLPSPPLSSPTVRDEVPLRASVRLSSPTVGDALLSSDAVPYAVDFFFFSFSADLGDPAAFLALAAAALSKVAERGKSALPSLSAASRLPRLPARFGGVSSRAMPAPRFTRPTMDAERPLSSSVRRAARATAAMAPGAVSR